MMSELREFGVSSAEVPFRDFGTGLQVTLEVCSGPRPSSSRPSSRKKSIAAARSSTTMPTLSMRLTAMLPVYKRRVSMRAESAAGCWRRLG